jgi:hypothetical protein
MMELDVQKIHHALCWVSEVKLDFVKDHKFLWTIAIQSKAFGVFRSGYYKHLKREPGKTAINNYGSYLTHR